MLIDSHCHLNSIDNLDEVVKRAKGNGVDIMLNAGGKFD